MKITEERKQAIYDANKEKFEGRTLEELLDVYGTAYMQYMDTETNEKSQEMNRIRMEVIKDIMKSMMK